MENLSLQPTPALPFELIFNIVTLVEDNKPTLNAISQTNRLLHSDAVKHLYASTPALYLKWADHRATSGMKFLSTIHNSPDLATLVRTATIGIVKNPNTISVRVVVSELRKMRNVTHLIITPIYGPDGREEVEIPGPLSNAKFGFNLKILTWRGQRYTKSISFLYSLLDSHRTTLEKVDLRLEYDSQHILPYSQTAIVHQVRILLEQALLSSLGNTGGDLLDEYPWSRLYEFTGSMEVLDIFLPLIASSETLQTLRLVPPDSLIPFRQISPDILHLRIPDRVLKFMEKTSLISLSLDLSSGWTLNLERFLGYHPTLESLKLRGIYRNPAFDSFAVFSLLQHLRFLTVAMKIEVDDPPSYDGNTTTNLEKKMIHHFQPCGLIPSVFAHCPKLQEVRLELEGSSVKWPLWQVFLNLDNSPDRGKLRCPTNINLESLGEWWSNEDYPNLNLYTYMGIAI
ncbi:hypothetical protein BJ165DRAFT_1534488 [Panaeolus papilionaceus]|nr:hypothetical protein BJ165DRAFT_1534488 [Panaeolus papilionaceus]